MSDTRISFDHSWLRINIWLRKNAANMVSLAGALPLLFLYSADAIGWLPWIIVLNNIADDLDGLVAGWLNTRSKFGAHLDNVCDALVHGNVVLFMAMHFGGASLVTGMLAMAAIVIRSTSRLSATTGPAGSPTNELMRHCLLLLLVAELGWVSVETLLPALFLIHSLGMLLPAPMRGMIRSLTTQPYQVVLLNLFLAFLVASQVPLIILVSSVIFYGTYAGSLLFALIAYKNSVVR